MSKFSPVTWLLWGWLWSVLVVGCTAVSPTPIPTPSPSPTATNQPTLTPTTEPTPSPTNQPTLQPTIPPTPPPLYYLGYQLDEATAPFRESGGLVTYYIQDLRTGETLVHDPDIAVAGTSMVKIPILIEAYRTFNGTPNSYHTKLLTETAELSGNYSANLLLGFISGDDDPYNGTDALTARLRELGLYNTFIAAPYDSLVRPGRPLTFITPANSRLDVTTNPDPNMQTTAWDMGTLLSWLYACSQGDMSTPLTMVAEGLSAEGCTAVLTLMTRNKIESLIEEGVPAGVPIAHKHGWIGDTHGDAGIVLAEDAPYVIVMMLHKPGWLEWGESSPLMAEISRLTYTHFTDPTALYPANLALPEPTPAPENLNPLPDLPRAIVINTQGIGLRLRQTPGGNEIAILPEGSVVILLEEAPREVDGTLWRQVQSGNGDIGWVGADYLLTD
jgi:beta-lactamase class A